MWIRAWCLIWNYFSQDGEWGSESLSKFQKGQIQRAIKPPLRNALLKSFILVNNFSRSIEAWRGHRRFEKDVFSSRNTHKLRELRGLCFIICCVVWHSASWKTCISPVKQGRERFQKTYALKDPSGGVVGRRIRGLLLQHLKMRQRWRRL